VPGGFRGLRNDASPTSRPTASRATELARMRSANRGPGHPGSSDRYHLHFALGKRWKMRCGVPRVLRAVPASQGRSAPRNALTKPLDRGYHRAELIERNTEHQIKVCTARVPLLSWRRPHRYGIRARDPIFHHRLPRSGSTSSADPGPMPRMARATMSCPTCTALIRPAAALGPRRTSQR